MAFALPATTADGRIIQNTAISTKSHIPITSICRFVKPFPCSCFHPFLQTKTTPKSFCSAISSSTGSSSEIELLILLLKSVSYSQYLCEVELNGSDMVTGKRNKSYWVKGAETSSAAEGTASQLDNVVVFDLNGMEIPISDLWKDRKAVVAFARHFGCVLCRKRADYLANEKDKLDAAGVALVLIGPGSVDQAKTFSEQTKFQGEVYADPSYSSYKALNFVSGVSTTFSSGAGLKIIKAYLEGYRQDWALSFEKDTRTRGGWQQGGIIVAGPGKKNISYIHKDKEAGDEPDIEDIFKACCLQVV